MFKKALLEQNGSRNRAVLRVQQQERNVCILYFEKGLKYTYSLISLYKYNTFFGVSLCVRPYDYYYSHIKRMCV